MNIFTCFCVWHKAGASSPFGDVVEEARRSVLLMSHLIPLDSREGLKIGGRKKIQSAAKCSSILQRVWKAKKTKKKLSILPCDMLVLNISAQTICGDCCSDEKLLHTTLHINVLCFT